MTRFWRITPKARVVFLTSALVLAVIVIAVLAVAVVRAPEHTEPQQQATLESLQKPPIVDVEGLKQRTQMMDKLVQYFTALSSGDDATVYSMSCTFMQASYDKDQRAGLKQTVATMTTERGPAHVQIPTSIYQPTNTTGTVETTIFYERPIAALSGKTFERVQVQFDDQNGAWRICSVASI